MKTFKVTIDLPDANASTAVLVEVAGWVAGDPKELETQLEDAVLEAIHWSYEEIQGGNEECQQDATNILKGFRL